jgi:tRNA pseudouridine38-40 synthase
MSTFRLTLEYDGTDFAGWRSDAPGERTVHGTLLGALEELATDPVRLSAPVGTDPGVHAEGQVALAELSTPRDAASLRSALNAKLPSDVALHEAAAIDSGTGTDRRARATLHRYWVWNGAEASPLRRRRFHHVPARLDVERMGKASAPLAGQHDFASFLAAGAAASTTVQTLTRVTVSGAPGGEAFLEFEGDALLRHMVCIMVGTLIEVGAGRRPADSIPELLTVRDRRWAGPAAPASGLTLVRVGL